MAFSSFIKIIGVCVHSVVHASPLRASLIGINMADKESTKWPFVCTFFSLFSKISQKSLDVVQARAPRCDLRGLQTLNH